MYKKIGVFGLGLSGIATMKFLQRQNLSFVAYDDNEATRLNVMANYPELGCFLKNIDDDAWLEIDCLVLSPGIALYFPQPHKIVTIAKEAKAQIICDIELFYLYNPNNFYIGVTGTNGKSTTTALITHILKFNNIDVVFGGNIGVPVLEIENKQDRVYVFELSSFQLDLLNKAKFNIAVMLNITPDHLDRHGDMQNYIKAKYKIFKNQTKNDYAIINADLSHSEEKFTFSTSGSADLSIVNNILYISGKVCEIEPNNYLLGRHNQQNLAAAISACLKFGLSLAEIMRAIPSFVGLKHRMQYLGKHQDVVYINDSKATNAESTSNALASFDNIIWIVGGVQKEGGIASLDNYFGKVKKALLIGKSQDDFAKILNDKAPWEKCNNLESAFKRAVELAQKNDVILLSPACASYDQWKNFEQRGEAFIDMFNNIVA